jgi:hypothetical protein
MRPIVNGVQLPPVEAKIFPSTPNVVEEMGPVINTMAVSGSVLAVHTRLEKIHAFQQVAQGCL